MFKEFMYRKCVDGKVFYGLRQSKVQAPRLSTHPITFERDFLRNCSNRDIEVSQKEFRKTDANGCTIKTHLFLVHHDRILDNAGNVWEWIAEEDLKEMVQKQWKDDTESLFCVHTLHTLHALFFDDATIPGEESFGAALVAAPAAAEPTAAAPAAAEPTATAPAVAGGSPAFDEEQDHLKSNVDTLLYVVNDRKLNDNQKLYHIHSYLNTEGYFCNAVFECLAAQTHFNRNSNTFSQAPYWPDLVSALQALKSTALGAASAASESSGAASVAAPAASEPAAAAPAAPEPAAAAPATAEPETCSVSYTRTVDKIDISTDGEPTVAALAAAEPIIAAPVDPTPEPVVTRPPPAYTSWGKFDDW
jgi:hypothetical protein